MITGLKILGQKGKSKDITQGKLWQFVQKYLPLTQRFDNDQFWIKENGTRKAIPMFAALILIEFSDVIFAVDSIPAIFAITTDPFIVYTSNVFAILGLRSLYFLLAGAISSFVFLKSGLALILCFIGLKMLGVISVPPIYSFAVIMLSLLVSICFSLLRRKP